MLYQPSIHHSITPVSHYSPSGTPLGEGFDRVVKKHGADCHLATGHASDLFMRKLVVDGMKLDLPDEVLKPITATRIDLERTTPARKLWLGEYVAPTGLGRWWRAGYKAAAPDGARGIRTPHLLIANKRLTPLPISDCIFFGCGCPMSPRHCIIELLR